ncbi:uncharacterized protein B0H18DRAFT_1121281 [Fomitopsis serialis]|uniref:uncharacterized protein n=1 Tax=Fomitopsis serialis TaxID=139415 RepID=UPI002008B52B|nr:uncharacterized protein B0H18DRAFT_1121281 [Neoantrodia serialis]KAH9921825.1 hypothetical protein B0H18DRAFT_1121281 [Neoantrodia serialis]
MSDKPKVARPVSVDELCSLAKKVVDIFAQHDLACCLTGDLACALQSVPRRPYDLVVVVASEAHKQEQLKEMATETDPDFYLITPKDPRAKHKALCYKLPHQSGERKRGCEVHVLVPGMLNIPEVPKDRIETLRGLPVMPLPVLMFMKLQTWSDRRVSVQSYMKTKQHDEDVKDIRELLAVIRGRGGDLSTKALWSGCRSQLSSRRWVE